MENITAIDGTQINYIRLGKGSPLIFLHGWSASARDWLPFAAELADKHDIICWDARGHGGHSHAPGTSMHIETMAQDLDQLIKHHDLDRVTLVGHSMGALTLWEYISQFGCDKLAGICIVDQSPKLVTNSDWPHGIYGNFDQQANSRLISELRKDFAEGLLQLVANGYNRNSLENYRINSRGFQLMREQLQQQEAAPLVQCWESLSAQDYRSVLPTITVPALLIYGDESQFYSKQVADYVAEQIPQSDLRTYEKSDHSPQLWHKERFVYDLKQFTQSYLSDNIQPAAIP
ncbi:MAG: alpha/beta hydrolase [Amphritea sp.]